MRIIAILLVLAAGLGACAKGRTARSLDLDDIRVSTDARLRTDTVGDGRFADTASFVLVDAENTAGQGAYVTLAGELTDESGAVLGVLNPQSLWVPAHETRTFALIDSERKPRPASTSASIKVRGAFIPVDAPRATIEELHEYTDQDRKVVQAYVVNGAPRTGTIMVIAAFHDAKGRPMTRPFSMVPVGANARKPVQFVGPAGSVKGTIFVGDTLY